MYAQTTPVIWQVEKTNHLYFARHRDEQHVRHHYDVVARPVFVKRDTGWAIAFGMPDFAKLYRLGSGRALNVRRRRFLPELYIMASETGIYQVDAPVALQPLKCRDSVFDLADISALKTCVSLPGVKRRAHLKPARLDKGETDAAVDSVNARLRAYVLREIPGAATDTGDSYYSAMYRGLYLKGEGGLRVKQVWQLDDHDKLFQVMLLPGTGSPFSITSFREDNGSWPLVFGLSRSDGRVALFYGDMRLLEHADFDGDGKEEYLFLYSLFNHYGYLLIYDDFKRSVHYLWSYH